MKSIFFFILGIILGIITIKLGWAAIVCLLHLAIISSAINGLFAFAVALLTMKCFKNI